MEDILKSTLGEIYFGEPQRFQSLCLLPLYRGGDSIVRYRMLNDALARREADVSETSERGEVPYLRVNNRSEFPLLLIDGEELAGAKQNRIVNASLLLEPKQATIIPVSCTEHGRWRYNSPRFCHSEVVMAARARFKKKFRLLYNLKKKAIYDAGQLEIWKDIEDLHKRHGSTSYTRAMKDIFLHRQKDVDNFRDAFTCLPGQCGMVVFVNGEVCGADYLSNPQAFRQVFEGLLKSYILDAIDRPFTEWFYSDWKIDAHLFLQSLLQADEVTIHQPVGLGRDVRYEGLQNNGEALVYQKEIIHLSVYSKTYMGAGILDDVFPEQRRQERLRRFTEFYQYQREGAEQFAFDRRVASSAQKAFQTFR